MKKKPRKTAASRWDRYRKNRSMYFVYPSNSPHVRKLLDTGKYGVVQLICIDNTARKAFMAGFRAGRRTSNGGARSGD